jgi:hypothetical protein
MSLSAQGERGGRGEGEGQGGETDVPMSVRTHRRVRAAALMSALTHERVRADAFFYRRRGW